MYVQYVKYVTNNIYAYKVFCNFVYIAIYERTYNYIMNMSSYDAMPYEEYW